MGMDINPNDETIALFESMNDDELRIARAAYDGDLGRLIADKAPQANIQFCLMRIALIDMTISDRRGTH